MFKVKESYQLTCRISQSKEHTKILIVLAINSNVDDFFSNGVPMFNI